jgi:hypothetical protein
LNRKKFLAYGGLGLAALGGMGSWNLLKETEVIPRAQLTRLDGLDSDSANILYLASLAPSGHNTQPWSVTIKNDGHWIIGTERQRWLPAVDPNNRETLLSLGAFLENLVTAAEAAGYSVKVDIPAASPADQAILDIKLQPAGARTGFNLEAIQLRRTLRNGFLSDTLSNDDLRFILGDDQNSIAYFPRDSAEGRYLQDGTILANKAQAYRDPAQLELAEWIRWSNSEIRRYMNGLTPETMEIEGVARWYVKLFYSRDSVLTGGFRETTIQKIQQQAIAGGGWLIITSPTSAIPELINTGRKLQRLWLKVRSKMIAIHPMTQILEEEPWQYSVADNLGVNGTVQFILRVGYVKSYPSPVSVRMPLDRFVRLL